MITSDFEQGYLAARVEQQNDEMTERTPQTVTSKDFRSLDSRFIFQGGSHFANQIADIIDELTALRQQLAEVSRERDGLRKTATGKMK